MRGIVQHAHRPGIHRALALATSALLVFACNQSPTAEEKAGRAAAKVAHVAAAVTGQKAPLADEATDGTFLGFDTFEYPGDEIMHAWKHAPSAPYSWVGYYLPSAPCHKGATWGGKRQTLIDMGWGLAVVYVGQQPWGRVPKTLTPAQMARVRKRGETCNADFLGAGRGIQEAIDAIRKTEAEGFPKGTVIFLDIERMENIPGRMRDYYKAWTATVLKDGRYRPGVYVHSHNAKDVYADVKGMFLAAGSDEEPRFWIASGRDFDPSKKPEDVGNWPSPSDVTD